MSRPDGFKEYPVRVREMSDDGNIFLMLVSGRQEDHELFRSAVSDSHLKLTLTVFEKPGEMMDYLEGRGVYADRNQFPLPGAVFLDLSSGSEEFSEIFRRRAEKEVLMKIPFVALLEHSRLSDAFCALELGAADCLLRPLDPELLKQKLYEIILPLKRVSTALLVDDDRGRSSRTVSELGRDFPLMKVQVAETEEEIYSALERGGFDVAVVNLSGEEKEILNTASLIKARHPECPVIVRMKPEYTRGREEFSGIGSDYYILESPGVRVHLHDAIRFALGKSWQAQMLRRSEERYRYISGLVSDYAYAFRVEEDGSMWGEWVTDSFVRVFGFTLDEIDRRGGWFTMLHPDDLSVAFEHARKVVGGQPDVGEFRFVTRDGQVRWLLDHATPVFDPARKRVVRIYGAARDITEQKRTDRLLQALNEASTFLARSTRVEEIFSDIKEVFEKLGFSCVLFPYDREHNRLQARFKGFEPGALRAVEGLIGSSSEQYYLPLLPGSVLEKAVKEGKPVFLGDAGKEIGFWLPDDVRHLGGEVTRILKISKAIFIPVLVNDGVVAVFIVFSDDLTEKDIPLFTAFGHQLAAAWERVQYIEQLRGEINQRIETEGLLRESEERYRVLAESSPDLITLVDEGLRILYTNINTAARFGARPPELINKQVGEIFPDDIAGRMESNLKMIFESGEARYVEAPAVISGESVWLSTWLVPIKGPDCKVRSVLVLSRDITRLKTSEQELERSYLRISTAFEGVVEALAVVTEAKDPYTAGHQRKVADLSRAIAQEMGLSPEQVEGIRIAGAIHDIGKIAVPAEVLCKPGPLNEVEWKMVKTHPEVGYEVLSKIDFPWPVARIVREHHERIDGSGYPRGLRGDEIMLEARIIAVADVVEAMSFHRPYRPAHGIDRALDEIRKNRGILYDPDVVDACLKLFTEKGYRFKSDSF